MGRSWLVRWSHPQHCWHCSSALPRKRSLRRWQTFPHLRPSLIECRPAWRSLDQLQLDPLFLYPLSEVWHLSGRPGLARCSDRRPQRRLWGWPRGGLRRAGAPHPTHGGPACAHGRAWCEAVEQFAWMTPRARAALSEIVDGYRKCRLRAHSDRGVVRHTGCYAKNGRRSTSGEKILQVAADPTASAVPPAQFRPQHRRRPLQNRARLTISKPQALAGVGTRLLEAEEERLPRHDDQVESFE